MRFIVIDEDGQALRAFRTRAEAVAFSQVGDTLRVIPKPVPAPSLSPYALALQAVGASPF